MLTQNLNQHKSLLAAKAAQIDRLNVQIRELSASHKTEFDRFLILQRRAKLRNERLKKIENLRRVLSESPPPQHSSDGKTPKSVGDADELDMTVVRHHHAQALPDPQVLKRYIRAYNINNTSLTNQSRALESKSQDLELSLIHI